jgi:ribosomal RNA-processing protein 17
MISEFSGVCCFVGRDFVTGFHKRKKKRRKEAQKQQEEAFRRKRIEARKNVSI